MIMKGKYTPGSTEYRFPAILDPEIETEIKEFALKSIIAVVAEICSC